MAKYIHAFVNERTALASAGHSLALGFGFWILPFLSGFVTAIVIRYSFKIKSVIRYETKKMSVIKS